MGHPGSNAPTSKRVSNPPSRKNSTETVQYISTPYDKYYQLCTCGDIKCEAGPSERQAAPPAGCAPWDDFDDEDPYLKAERPEEHDLMLVIFAEHVLSNCQALRYNGGTAEDRTAAVNCLGEVPRSILLQLIRDTTFPSPSRLSKEELESFPSYPAADVAEALFCNKDRFTTFEWYVICTSWFPSWTGVAPGEAWCMGLGRDERFVCSGIQQRRLRFRAWSWAVEGEYADLREVY
ncbi:hypothetical protein DRE_01158 [Drechslerella stenobrocha 248]|uniref:Uncharacterized protein n=1 Tax=Drechslerella stenobrocha 248 TaxID=1043628 RepID=W7HW85_9PEZI|nr:hypothetical protein DRE_01158 [Drechslerella stenobrocha 248]